MASVSSLPREVLHTKMLLHADCSRGLGGSARLRSSRTADRTTALSSSSETGAISAQLFHSILHSTFFQESRTRSRRQGRKIGVSIAASAIHLFQTTPERQRRFTSCPKLNTSSFTFTLLVFLSLATRKTQQQALQAFPFLISPFNCD